MAAGCSTVLPSVAQCVANTALAGCTAVLPTLAQCTANSSLAGCSAVVPTLAQCTANSSLAGCSTVLPTFTQCTANPALAGCSAVLPTQDECATNSAIAGCSVVLQALFNCTYLSPTAPGCAAVLQAYAATPAQLLISQINAQLIVADTSTSTNPNLSATALYPGANISTNTTRTTSRMYTRSWISFENMTQSTFLPI